MLLCDAIIQTGKAYEDPVALGFPRDYLHSAAHLAQLNVYRTMTHLLDGAVRYVLEPEVIEAACHVVMSKPTTIRDAMRLVRVPRQRMWVEWPDSARQIMRQHLGITVTNERPPPARFGFLLEADPTGRAGTCRYCWAHKADPGEPLAHYANVCVVGNIFDFDRIGRHDLSRASVDVEASGLCRRWRSRPEQIEALLDLDQCSEDRATPEGEKMINALATDISEAVALKMLGLAKDDIEGEFMQVLSVLILLSARNGVTRLPGPNLAKLNKARAKKKKPALLDHQIVTMRLNKGEQRASSGGGAGGLSTERRGALVQGHFVVRGKPRENIYWRREHWRSGTAPAATTKTVNVRM